MEMFLSALGIINSLGNGKAVVRDSLMRGETSGIKAWPSRAGEFSLARATPPAASREIPPLYANRVNAFLAAACDQMIPEVEEAVARYGRDRMAVLIGSTDNGSEETTNALADYRRDGRFPAGYSLEKLQPDLTSRFVSRYLNLESFTISASTACASSASAIVAARNLIQMGACAAAVVGGADIVSDTVLLGFHSLEAVDRGRCNPFSINRRGINLGEGAALFILAPDPVGDSSVRLLGAGESSDAWHMTAPSPEGEGAVRAMQAALRDAGITPGDIDYVNLHGTGTQLNDSMESKAFRAVLPESVPCSSTKSLVGHTLGAAGAMELAFCWLALTQPRGERCLPPQVWDGKADPALPALNLVSAPRRAERLDVCMSNTFAFGGCNVSLLVGA